MGARLSSLTSGELQAVGAAVLLIPLGATEQHGPHLQLGTDTDIATAWAERTVESLNDRAPIEKALNGETLNAVIAPPLPYGSSGEHQAFPGTLSIGQEALELVIIELIRSAANDFTKMVLLSGHGGNLQPVERAVERLVAEGHDALHLFPTWSPAEASSIDAHAGRTETSIMLHLHPDTVRTERLAPGQTKSLSELMPTLMSHGISAVAPSGVLGDPTKATELEGRQLLDTLVAKTVDVILGQNR